MTKVAYLDCPTGIAGDMCLGALVDLGVPLDYLAETLSRLGNADEYQLEATTVHHNGQRATQVQVKLQHGNQTAIAPPSRYPTATEIVHSHPHHSHPHHSHPHHSHPSNSQAYHPLDQEHSHSHHPPKSASSSPPHLGTRHLPDIERMIQGAGLPPRSQAWSLAVFRRLAEAEGAVHGISPDQVHFHEVGATDAIVDIVGTCLGLDWLGIDKLYCSALPTGGGTVRAAHGRLPVPVPAVLKLWELRQVPIYSNGIDHELVTPTGAAIATTLATQFGAPPAMTLLRVGLGAGSLSLPLPNILRLWIGERSIEEPAHPKAEASISSIVQPAAAHLQPPSASVESIVLLETQIDDLNPQAIGYVLERLLAIGALDVFTQAIGMKKSRPGILLAVVCRPADVAACEAVLFRETSTLGIRRSVQQRQVLAREIQTVQTGYGPVRVKVAWAAGLSANTPLNVQPEYEDCAAIARQHQIPWREVHRLAAQSWHMMQQSHSDSLLSS